MRSYNPYYNYIAHHGIKGQEWGVKNGPPYPLDEAGVHINYDHRNKNNRVTEIKVDDKSYKKEKKEANKRWKSVIKKNLLKTAVAIALIDPILMIGGFNPVVFPAIGKVMGTAVGVIKAKALGGLIGKKTAKTSVKVISGGPNPAAKLPSTAKKLQNAAKVLAVGGVGGAAATNRLMDVGGTRIGDIVWQ